MNDIFFTVGTCMCNFDQSFIKCINMAEAFIVRHYDWRFHSATVAKT